LSNLDSITDPQEETNDNVEGDVVNKHSHLMSNFDSITDPQGKTNNNVIGNVDNKRSQLASNSITYTQEVKDNIDGYDGSGQLTSNRDRIGAHLDDLSNDQREFNETDDDDDSSNNSLYQLVSNLKGITNYQDEINNTNNEVNKDKDKASNSSSYIVQKEDSLQRGKYVDMGSIATTIDSSKTNFSVVDVTLSDILKNLEENEDVFNDKKQGETNTIVGGLKEKNQTCDLAQQTEKSSPQIILREATDKNVDYDKSLNCSAVSVTMNIGDESISGSEDWNVEGDYLQQFDHLVQENYESSTEYSTDQDSSMQNVRVRFIPDSVVGKVAIDSRFCEWKKKVYSLRHEYKPIYEDISEEEEHEERKRGKLSNNLKMVETGLPVYDSGSQSESDGYDGQHRYNDFNDDDTEVDEQSQDEWDKKKKLAATPIVKIEKVDFEEIRKAIRKELTDPPDDSETKSVFEEFSMGNSKTSCKVLVSDFANSKSVKKTNSKKQKYKAGVKEEVKPPVKWISFLTEHYKDLAGISTVNASNKKFNRKREPLKRSISCESAPVSGPAVVKSSCTKKRKIDLPKIKQETDVRSTSQFLKRSFSCDSSYDVQDTDVAKGVIPKIHPQHLEASAYCENTPESSSTHSKNDITALFRRSYSCEPKIVSSFKIPKKEFPSRNEASNNRTVTPLSKRSLSCDRESIFTSSTLREKDGMTITTTSKRAFSGDSTLVSVSVLPTKGSPVASITQISKPISWDSSNIKTNTFSSTFKSCFSNKSKVVSTSTLSSSKDDPISQTNNPIVNQTPKVDSYVPLSNEYTSNISTNNCSSIQSFKNPPKFISLSTTPGKEVQVIQTNDRIPILKSFSADPLLSSNEQSESGISLVGLSSKISLSSDSKVVVSLASTFVRDNSSVSQTSNNSSVSRDNGTSNVKRNPSFITKSLSCEPSQPQIKQTSNQSIVTPMSKRSVSCDQSVALQSTLPGLNPATNLKTDKFSTTLPSLPSQYRAVNTHAILPKKNVEKNKSVSCDHDVVLCSTAPEKEDQQQFNVASNDISLQLNRSLSNDESTLPSVTIKSDFKEPKIQRDAFKSITTKLPSIQGTDTFKSQGTTDIQKRAECPLLSPTSMKKKLSLALYLQQKVKTTNNNQPEKVGQYSQPSLTSSLWPFKKTVAASESVMDLKANTINNELRGNCEKSTEMKVSYVFSEEANIARNNQATDVKMKNAVATNMDIPPLRREANNTSRLLVPVNSQTPTSYTGTATKNARQPSDDEEMVEDDLTLFADEELERQIDQQFIGVADRPRKNQHNEISTDTNTSNHQRRQVLQETIQKLRKLRNKEVDDANKYRYVFPDVNLERLVVEDPRKTISRNVSDDAERRENGGGNSSYLDAEKKQRNQHQSKQNSTAPGEPVSNKIMLPPTLVVNTNIRQPSPSTGCLAVNITPDITFSGPQPSPSPVSSISSASPDLGGGGSAAKVKQSYLKLPHRHEDGTKCVTTCTRLPQPKNPAMMNNTEIRGAPSKAYFKFPHRHSDGTYCETVCSRVLQRERARGQLPPPPPPMKESLEMFIEKMSSIPWKLIPIDFSDPFPPPPKLFDPRLKNKNRKDKKDSEIPTENNTDTDEILKPKGETELAPDIQSKDGKDCIISITENTNEFAQKIIIGNEDKGITENAVVVEKPEEVKKEELNELKKLTDISSVQQQIPNTIAEIKSSDIAKVEQNITNMHVHHVGIGTKGQAHKPVLECANKVYQEVLKSPDSDKQKLNDTVVVNETKIRTHQPEEKLYDPFDPDTSSESMKAVDISKSKMYDPFKLDDSNSSANQSQAGDVETRPPTQPNDDHFELIRQHQHSSQVDLATATPEVRYSNINTTLGIDTKLEQTDIISRQEMKAKRLETPDVIKLKKIDVIVQEQAVDGMKLTDPRNKNADTSSESMKKFNIINSELYDPFKLDDSNSSANRSQASDFEPNNSLEKHAILQSSVDHIDPLLGLNIYDRDMVTTENDAHITVEKTESVIAEECQQSSELASLPPHNTSFPDERVSIGSIGDYEDITDNDDDLMEISTVSELSDDDHDKCSNVRPHKRDIIGESRARLSHVPELKSRTGRRSAGDSSVSIRNKPMMKPVKWDVRDSGHVLSPESDSTPERDNNFHRQRKSIHSIQHEIFPTITSLHSVYDQETGPLPAANNSPYGWYGNAQCAIYSSNHQSYVGGVNNTGATSPHQPSAVSVVQNPLKRLLESQPSSPAPTPIPSPPPDFTDNRFHDCHFQFPPPGPPPSPPPPPPPPPPPRTEPSESLATRYHSFSRTTPETPLSPSSLSMWPVLTKQISPLPLQSQPLRATTMNSLEHQSISPQFPSILHQLQARTTTDSQYSPISPVSLSPVSPVALPTTLRSLVTEDQSNSEVNRLLNQVISCSLTQHFSEYFSEPLNEQEKSYLLKITRGFVISRTVYCHKRGDVYLVGRHGNSEIP